jgi:hypothetical protein
MQSLVCCEGWEKGIELNMEEKIKTDLEQFDM